MIMTYLKKVLPLTASLFLSQQLIAQTLTIDYTATGATTTSIPPEVIPVLGGSGLLILGLMLAVVGALWIRKHPHARLSKLAVTAVGIGLLSSATSGGWLATNAQAVVATTQYLLSSEPNPVVIDQFPAELNNDFAVQATLNSLVISGCPDVSYLNGTCAEDTVLAASGGSCAIDSICTVCGNDTVDPGEEYDPPPGPFASAEVNAQSCRYDFSSVSQFYCNGSCSISGVSGCDQTEADRFCKIKTDNPLSTATSFDTTIALAEPGFSCANQSFGVDVDMTSRGVTETIAYQDSSLLANHGSGTVIIDVVCTEP